MARPIARQVEALAEALVMAEPSDLPALAKIHTLLETLDADAAQAGFAGVPAAAAALVEQVVLDETENPADHLKAVGRAISCMQAILRDGRDPAEIAWPEALGLPTADAAGAANTAEATPAGHPQNQDTPAGSAADALDAALVPILHPEEVDTGILVEFVTEAKEHLDGADVHLLTLESEPQNTEALNAVFRTFHTIKGAAGYLGLQEIQTLAHDTETLLDKARKGTLACSQPILDTVFDCVDRLKALRGGIAAYLNDGTQPTPDPEVPALLEHVQRAAAGETPSEAAATLPGAEADGAFDAPPGPRNGPDERAPAADRPRTVAPGAVQETVRVEARRLDQLIDTIGELVIVESMVSQAAAKNGRRNELSRPVSRLDKITRELQEIGTSLRMVPVRSTFQKMARLVRDLSRKSGKPVTFHMSGEDTELDKSVVDQIGDPLVHMVRNAVDHGIEDDTAARRRRGKPEQGRIELRATHKGGNIYIEIEDDGRGLDREKLLAKAHARGLVEDGSKLSDRDVYKLIFHPGFSTANQVTDISGRGVGMDVVKRNIDSLRGQVEIDSEPGRGTVFRLRLPLTLAIIDGMIIRVGDERYIIPALNIFRSVRLKPEDIATLTTKGELFKLHGEVLPLFRLSRLFDITEAETDLTKALVVVVEDGDRRVGIVVDELVGQQQIVIKNLGGGIQKMPGLSGGAIMPDGQVGLILDIEGLVKLAHAGRNGTEQPRSQNMASEAPTEALCVA